MAKRCVLWARFMVPLCAIFKKHRSFCLMLRVLHDNDLGSFASGVLSIYGHACNAVFSVERDNFPLSLKWRDLCLRCVTQLLVWFHDSLFSLANFPCLLLTKPLSITTKNCILSVVVSICLHSHIFQGKMGSKVKSI